MTIDISRLGAACTVQWLCFAQRWLAHSAHPAAALGGEGMASMLWLDQVDGDLELFNLLAVIDDLADLSGIHAFLGSLVDIYGVKSVAYLGSGLTGQPGEEPYVAVTYSESWVEHYKAERFVDIDPAVQVGMRRMLPIDWSEFDRAAAPVRRLFGEAAEFGLGRNGISLPIHDQRGGRALFSITSDANNREWRRLRLHYMRDFQILAFHVHEAVLRLKGMPKNRTDLSPRERDCLMWVAEGKTAWETAVILGLSEHTVRCYLESARHKLGAANNTHAVNKAGKARLLTPFS